MAFLPNPATLIEAVGSGMNNVYTLQNDNGTLMNLIGRTFEFSIRTDPAQPTTQAALITVNSTSSTSSGSITVNIFTSQVTVVINASAMATLSQNQYYYTLWMDPGLAGATAMVSGTLFAQNIAQP